MRLWYIAELPPRDDVPVVLEVEVVLVLVLDSEFRCGDVEADGALVLVPQLPQGLHDELAALAVRSTSSIGHPPHSSASPATDSWVSL